MAEKLTASTSSAEMLTYVLSSLASEGLIGNSLKQSSPLNDYPLQKKPMIDNDQLQPYIPSSQNSQPQPPLPSDQQPPLPLQPVPPVQPYQVTQFLQSPGIETGTGAVQYGHSINQPQSLPMSLPGFPIVGSYTLPLPSESYQNFQIEGGFYSQQSGFSLFENIY